MLRIITSDNDKNAAEVVEKLPEFKGLVVVGIPSNDDKVTLAGITGAFSLKDLCNSREALRKLEKELDKEILAAAHKAAIEEEGEKTSDHPLHEALDELEKLCNELKGMF